MGRTRSTTRVSLTDRLSGLLLPTRVGGTVAHAAARMRSREIPRQWSHWFGVVPPALVLVLVVTGVPLTFLYSPSSELIDYRGSYEPLQGMVVSRAFDSVMGISFEAPGGLLLRQTHHWAALALPAALCVQLAIIFFTGGFRRPRRLGWLLLVGVLLLALGTGWTGYALPDDLLAGTGLRITEGVALGIPVVGTWISAVLFGGGFPGDAIERLAPLHVVVLPVALLAVLIWRSTLVLRRPAAVLPSARAPGSDPTWPRGLLRAVGLGAATAGIVLAVGATVTIAPVWLNGPSDPASAGAGSQPDWYTGFLDGALRLVPPGWEFEWLGATWTAAVLVPLLVVGVFIAVVAGYPFLEERLVPAGIDLLVLDRPRNAATRTAVGAAGIAFVGTLWAAGAADHAAVQFHLSLEAVLVCFQAAVVLVPPATFAVTRRLCLGLQRKDLEIVAHGRETGRIVRLPGGRYTEVHEGGGVAEEWRLGDASGHTAEASAVFPGDSPRSGGVIRESRKVDTP